MNINQPLVLVRDGFRALKYRYENDGAYLLV